MPPPSIVLGGVFTGTWRGGTFEAMATQGKQCCYYVDKDYNGGVHDFPYSYCIVSISYTVAGSSNSVIAHAFDVVTGEVSMKVVQSFGSARDYPWRVIPIGLPSFYKNYGTLNALCTAISGITKLNNYTFGGYYDNDNVPDGFSVYSTNSPSTSIANPPSGLSGIALMFTAFDASITRGIQILICGGIWFRNNFGSWDNWVQMVG